MVVSMAGLEHIGFNVNAPVEQAAWFCEHLGMTVARKFGPPQFGHFLADARGGMMLEFYHNAAMPVPDYAALLPMSFHVAFQVDDVASTREKLLRAGASAEGDITRNSDGDQIALVRNPWGLTVQLVKRAQRML